MRSIILFCLLVSCLSSCASYMNGRKTKIKIFTEKPTELIIQNKPYTIEKKAKIFVDRSPDTLDILVKQDTFSRKIGLASKKSIYYYGNVFTWVGFIWDSKSDKRFTYQKNLYIDLSKDKLSTFRPGKKGQLDILFSLPHINSFYLRPPGETAKKSVGFWGLSSGLAYYYKDNKSISLTASGVMDFFLPIPAAVDLSGEHELMSSTYLSLTDNFKSGNFSFGYGINYSKNNWNLRYYDRFDPPPPTRDPVLIRSKSMGFTFNTYWQRKEHFHLGLIYRPTFFRLMPKQEFIYEHLISIDFAWKWKTNW